MGADDGAQVRIQQARAEGTSYTQLARRFPQFSRSALYRHTHGKHRERPLSYAAYKEWQGSRQACALGSRVPSRTSRRTLNDLLPLASRIPPFSRHLANSALIHTRRKGLIGAHLPLKMIGTKIFLTIQGKRIKKASRSVPSRL
jgi:hypothetical protein